MPHLAIILVVGLTAAFCASVVWALWWALKGGQLSNFQRGANSIFDADEPVGKVTDSFPGQTPPTKPPSGPANQ